MAVNLDSARAGPSVISIVAINSVLVAGVLSFGIFPVMVDGLVRLAHLGVREAGLCVTAEMAGQAVGAAGVLVLRHRMGSRHVCGIALALILFGNALSMGVTGSLLMLLIARSVAGIGCGLTVVCIGLFATTKNPERNFAIFNAAAVVLGAALAAAAPFVYRCYGMIGIFAAIGGAAGLCLMMVPFIPEFGSKAPGQEAKAAQANFSPGPIALACIMAAGFFISTGMFWSYAGQIGAWHHLDVTAVSSAVASAWLIGGLLGSILAAPTSRRVSRTVSTVACSAGTALVAFASTIVGDTKSFAVLLHGFVFLWFLLYPIQMGIFSEVDASGQLTMLAYLSQLIALAVGPALGGLILQSNSYYAFGLWCGLGYLIFICAALILLRSAYKSSRDASVAPSG
jgi:MFS family permease